MTGIQYCSAASPPRFPRETRYRVLVIEFRDEVYAALFGVLEEWGCQVQRASSAVTVAAMAAQAEAHDLILLNQQMPAESGWLIACKLRLTSPWQPIWIYTAFQIAHQYSWPQLARVNALLDYRGDVRTLTESIKYKLANQHDELVAPVSPQAMSLPATPAA